MANGERSGNDIPWHKVREDYIQGMQWKDLEDKYNVTRAAISHHRRDGGWHSAKKEREAEVMKKLEKVNKKQTIHNMIKYNEITEEAVDQANRVARNAMIKIARREDGNDQPITHSQVNLMNLLVNVLRNAMEIKRLVNNLPSRVTELPPAEPMQRELAIDDVTPEIADKVNEVLRYLEDKELEKEK